MLENHCNDNIDSIPKSLASFERDIYDLRERLIQTPCTDETQANLMANSMSFIVALTSSSFSSHSISDILPGKGVLS